MGNVTAGPLVIFPMALSPSSQSPDDEGSMYYLLSLSAYKPLCIWCYKSQL